MAPVAVSVMMIACMAAARACRTHEGPVDQAAPEPAPAPRGTAALPLHHGIDVSVHSGAVDWDAVRAAGFTFAVLKASEGVDLPDRSYDGHWRELSKTGLVRGAYHFYVTEDPPEDQARLFLGTARLAPGDLAPVVDVEVIGHGTAPGLAERLRRFLDILEEHYGAPPIIYTSPDFWNAHLDGTFGRYPLWVAEYGVDRPRLPAGWDRWHLWQFEDDHELPAVEKDADLSRVNDALREEHYRLLIPPPGPVADVAEPVSEPRTATPGGGATRDR